MTRRRDKRIIPLCLGIFVAVSSFAFLINRNNRDVEAADLSKFRPGNIISDYVMSNYRSMTKDEIQAFLTKKNPCNNRNRAYYDELVRLNPGVRWHWKDDHFVCISEELFGDGETIGEGKTAAEIIYETANEYKINPQVLIVLIQKESGLITDPIPNNYDYRTMTGFGCPDTAPCSSQYFGFKNQIRKAAWLFREVLDGGWTNYPLGENYVQYSPNAACGGSIVNIENLATSSLYRYTPYQPNAAALAAGTGTAPCGAYGNRNFYAYFSDWFGDPTEIGAVGSIKMRYKTLGEKNSPLGAPIGTTNCEIGHKGACVQAYVNGTIIYSEEYNAWESFGAIRKKHIAAKTIDGPLGFPKGPQECDKDYKNCTQQFEGGLVVSRNNDAWIIPNEILKRYKSAKETLGIPQEDATCEGKNCVQKFENYTIILENGRYFVIKNEIYAEYKKMEEKTGKPIGDSNCNIGHDGACVQVFENGVIIHHPSNGTWLNGGETRARYVSSGSVDGIFGFPTNNEQCSNDGSVCYQEFENGSIAEIGNNTYSTKKEIIQRYIETKQYLRDAFVDVNCNIGHDGACVQAFENGVIISNDETGTWENFGMIRSRYIAQGSIDGELGFPTGEEECNVGGNGACSQQFEGGAIIAQAKNGTHIVPSAIYKRYAEIGGTNSSLGLPSGVVNCNIGHDGACVQLFENGVIIYSPKHGAWENSGEIRTKYIANGSVDGTYGFPTSGVTNGCQSFEKGKICNN